MNQYLQTALEAIETAHEEMNDLKDENENLKKELQEQEKLAHNYVETEEIELQGGIIYFNIASLNYITRESFKDWIQKHAITNSEPTFNL